MKTLNTNSSIDGLARGKAFIVTREPEALTVSVGTIDNELNKFQSALLSVREIPAHPEPRVGRIGTY